VRDSICECVTPQDKLGLYAVPLQSHNNSDIGFLQQQFTVNEGRDLKFVKHITHLRINMVIVITLYLKFYTILFIVMHCFAKLSRKTDKADFIKQYLHSKKTLESPKMVLGYLG
jgi:phage-related protein